MYFIPDPADQFVAVIINKEALATCWSPIK
jgi:hypothetical protein